MEKAKRKKRIADAILIGALLLTALGLLLFRQLSRRDGGEAVVYVNGERLAAYALDTDCEVRLPSPDGRSFNVLVISDGAADVTDAGCPDKLCVHMPSIRYEGESIICLPNRLTVVIEGGESSGVDIP